MQYFRSPVASVIRAQTVACGEDATWAEKGNRNEVTFQTAFARPLVPVGFLTTPFPVSLPFVQRGLLFSLERAGVRFLTNVDTYLQNYTVSHTRRQIY